MKIGLVVIGVGRWGTHLVRNFLSHPQANLVAIVDSHREKLVQIREKFNLDESTVLATNWKGVKKLPGINAVVVVTPASEHYPLIAEALKLGYHVLSEKPLTLEVSGALELTRLAEQKNKQLFVDHTYLFHPAVDAGHKAIQSGQLGKLRYGYSTRTHLAPVRQDVDALWDLAIHDICIFNSWLGEFPIQVQATGSVWLQPSPGLSDLVWVTLIYPSGFKAYIHLCWLNPDKQRRLCIVGSKGTMIFDEMCQEAPLSIQKGYFEQKQGLFLPSGEDREVLEVEEGEPLGKMCDHFLQCVSNNSLSLISSGWVGSKLVAILSALSQSLSEKGRIVDVSTENFKHC